MNRFIKPTLQDVENYCSGRNNGIDAGYFYDHYEMCGWVVGKNKPMKDWQAAVRLWERKRKQWREEKIAAVEAASKRMPPLLERLTDITWSE